MCLRAEILGACFVPQQPLFSVRIKVMESITNILRKTARLELDNEKNDNYVLKLPVEKGENEEEEEEDEEEEVVEQHFPSGGEDIFPDGDGHGFSHWWGEQAKRHDRNDGNDGKKKKKKKKKKIDDNLPPACVSNVSPLITPLDKHLPLRSAAGNAVVACCRLLSLVC